MGRSSTDCFSGRLRADPEPLKANLRVREREFFLNGFSEVIKMEEEAKAEKKVKKFCESMGKNESCGGFAYFLGIIGAAVYYISVASGFWAGVLGFLKALVWPAFLVFEMLKFLGA